MEDKLITYLVDTDILSPIDNKFKALLLIYGCIHIDNKRYKLGHKYKDNDKIEFFIGDNKVYVMYDTMMHVTCRSHKIKCIRHEQHGTQKLSNGMIKCNRIYNDVIFAIKYALKDRIHIQPIFKENTICDVIEYKEPAYHLINSMIDNLTYKECIYITLRMMIEAKPYYDEQHLEMECALIPIYEEETKEECKHFVIPIEAMDEANLERCKIENIKDYMSWCINTTKGIIYNSGYTIEDFFKQDENKATKYVLKLTSVSITVKYSPAGLYGPVYNM